LQTPHQGLDPTLALGFIRDKPVDHILQDGKIAVVRTASLIVPLPPDHFPIKQRARLLSCITICRLLLGLTALSACTAKPVNQRFVAALDVDGNSEVETDEITEQLATRETSKLVGLVRGLVYEYETYNPHVLSEDLVRIERLYHARGFHHVSVRAGRVMVEKDYVRVTVVIDEGPRTSIAKVEFAGLEGLPPEVIKEAESAFESKTGANSPYDEETLQQANEALTRALQDQGYAFAKAQFAVRVDIARDTAYVFTKVETGPKIVLGSVELRGFKDMPEGVIRGYMPIKAGQVYRKSDFEETELELMNLGVFTSITVQLAHVPPEAAPDQEAAQGEGKTKPIDPETGEQDASRSQPSPDTVEGVGVSTATLDKAKLAAPTPATSVDRQARRTVVSPVVVEARLTKLRAFAVGGGLGADVIKSEVHVMTSWRDQNLLGGLRDFLVSVTPGLAFYPTRVPHFSAPEHLLPQVKSLVQFSQPGWPEAKTKTVSSLSYDIYPVLLSSNPPDDAPVVGYREFRGRAGVERKFGKVTLVPSYNLQAGVPFTYVGELEPSATSVYISYLELLTELDLRNDRLHPVEGFFASTAVQVAGLGGSARDVRIQPEIRGYVPVVRGKTGFAARLGFGFLFPFNYDTPQGQDDVSVQDTQIAYFRSFFSGGPISNRGYPFRGVGPHGAVPFFYPSYAAATAGVDCDSSDAQFTPACSIPLGGRTLWEASVEFRFLIWGPLTGTFFCDGSDVYEETTFPTFGRPHLSCGVGPRFDTPVGPIRLDVGYRIPGLQVAKGESRNEGPTNDLLGLPINISFGIGEAF
jgi:hypothetical protein